MPEKRLDLLFTDVPINDREFIRKTFVNRQKEINSADMFFRPDSPLKKLYAVHGFSRVGKSHLAIKVAHDMVKKFELDYFYVNANIKGKAYDVLLALYFQVKDFVLGLDMRRPKSKEAIKSLHFLKTYLEDINDLFLMPVVKKSFRNTRELSRSLSPKFKVPLIISLGGNRKTTDLNDETVELTKPDIDGIRVILCFLLNLVSFITEKPVLILIDDLDVLEELESGESERDVLTSQLKFFGELKETSVMVTTRQEYVFERDKEMLDFLNVSFLEEVELMDIYRSRVRNFHNDEPVFEDAAVKRLANGFRGIVGSFLKECYLFLNNFSNKEFPINEHYLDEHLKIELKKLRTNRKTEAILSHIGDKVKNSETEIVLKDIQKGHGLIYRLLIPKGYPRDTFEILPLFAGAVKQLQDNDEW